ncbi:DNA alkylation repair protein [Bacillus shivajii]|uniref:DNA alkylation repair protein n=1 Tax=Bacillus shivajii TaxID=1983719 RepID=UPI001CFBB96C|nr:DNA alkylation repair protein [Bacillus shivajii]UCZ53096.1 DNA alkylation repair protein [Bacillus shivajii]
MYVKKLKERLEPHANKENARPMEKYMKNHFPFLGIKSPELKQHLKAFFHETGILKEKEIKIEVIEELWNLPEREYQYAALNILYRKRKLLHDNHVPLLQTLVTTKSWWDTVDTIASNIIGSLFLKESELNDMYVPLWSSHENLWLRRTAILYQLKYKEQTDAKRLFQVIQLNSHSDEFFIQKAIGWALREYSKTAPETVESFIEKEQLSKLSVREGLKHIKRENIKSCK